MRKTGYPKYDKSSQKGEIGVQLVSDVVVQQLKWIFKRNHQEHDFGIDGQIEIVRDDDSVTGQLVAVQIKCGLSYFSTENRWGYVYRGEEKHFNYLCNYPIPVLILLCNPDSKKIFWQLFEPLNTNKHPNSWTLNIPKSNKFSDAKEEILSLFSEEIDYLADLEWYWEINNVISQEEVSSHLIIPKEYVNSGNISEAIEFFDRLMVTKELAYESQGKVEVYFWGYDDDPRELFQIEEVRKYSQKLSLAIPQLLFFCNLDNPSGGFLRIALCHTDVDITDTMISNINKQKLASFIFQQMKGLNQITDWLSMSTDENNEISSKALSLLGFST